MIDIRAFKKNGYTLLNGIFSEKLIHDVLTDAKKVFYRQFVRLKIVSKSFEKLSEVEFNEALFSFFKEDLTSFAYTGKQVQHLISLHKLSLHEKIIGLLEEVGIKTPIISTRPVMFFNHKKLSKEKIYYKVDSHQDWRSMQGSLNSMVIWIPLMDISIKEGALEILPRSHKYGLLTNRMYSGFGMVDVSAEQENQFIPIEVKAGDALIFSSFLIHRSGDNSSKKPRWSCHFRYNDLSEPTFINRGYAHPYIYKPQEELITPGFPSKEVIQKMFE